MSNIGCLKGCPKGTKLRSSEHPGFHYKGQQMNTFQGKYCVASAKGAFFGHVPRFINYEDASEVSCLTVFPSKESANSFATKQMEVANHVN